jgi:hypothetical protein
MKPFYNCKEVCVVFLVRSRKRYYKISQNQDLLSLTNIQDNINIDKNYVKYFFQRAANACVVW